MTYVGQRVPSLTNTKLVAGRGRFVDDITLPGMTYAAVLRSPFAHARIRSIDTSQAEALPGVVYVITGREVAESMNPIPETYDTAAVGAKGVKWYALCVDRARYVGEAVAAVVAEDKFTAYAALDLIEVDYEPLPVAADPEEAMKEGAPLVEPDWGDNIMASRDIVLGDPDAAFAAADGTVSGYVRSARITGTAIEPRGCLASYDAYDDSLTFWDSTQNPHPLRNYLAETLGMPDTSIRVIQPHVGGGFGLKIPTFQEEPLVAYLARKLKRPVKWIEERSENFWTGGHARDTRFYYEAAYMEDGTVTGIRLKVIADVGAPTALCGWGMSFVTWYCLPCVYKIPNSETHLRSVVTNKCPWNAYRGYGKDAASFLMDRIMDHIAHETGIDRAEVRFRNFIPPDEFPFPQVSGAMIDSGDYAKALRSVLDMIDYEGFPALQEQARAEGKRLGLGIGQELIPEGCSMPGSLLLNGCDGTEVRVSPTGEVTVLTGVTSPGSGNETGIAQIVADALGCTLDRIRVVQGDTESCPWGFGNYSARSVIIGGSAAHLAATDVKEKMLKVAGNMLEVAPDDLEAVEGRIFVRGTPDRGVSHDEVAHEVYRNPHGANMEGIEPALEAQRHFKIGNVYHQPETQGRFSAYPSWPNAVAACIVEVDDETGFVKVLRYCMVHDAGKIVNPLLAEANLHGGVAQGLGAALYEQIAYDEDAQPLTATFMDYTIPTAVEVPHIELGHQETLTPFTPLGTKGVGESGVGAPLGALCSAIENALPEPGLGGDPEREGEGGGRMISQEFEFHAPSTVAEAVELLAANAEDGKVLAGGMSLVPAMNLGIARPTAVISLNRVSELDYVRDDGDVLRIGAMTRHVRIETDPVIAGAFPLLGRAASVIGDVQVRNRGTIGGSVAHADPAADYLPVMLVLGASFKVASSSGERTIAARDFFQGVMATALKPHELLVEIELRKLPAGTGTSYLRLARLEGSFPLANGAAVVDGGPAVVAVGGTTAAPFLVEVESPEALDAVEGAACEAAVGAFDDLAATAEYRRAMAGLYARRAVEAALANRRGG